MKRFETVEQLRETVKPYTTFKVRFFDGECKGETRRAMLEPLRDDDGAWEADGHYHPKDCTFVFLKNSRKYGRRYKNSELIKIAEFDVMTHAEKAVDWEKRVKKVIAKLDDSKLWEELKRDYERLLELGYERRYEITIGADGFNDPHFKSMYFGKSCNEFEKRTIAERLKNKEKYYTRRRAQYDVSFSYDPSVGKAWYSEEYKDCGNGHYYIALDATTALFGEDD